MDYENRFNTKIKVYPDGNFKVTYCNKCIFAPPKEDKNGKNTSITNIDNEPIQEWEKELKLETQINQSYLFKPDFQSLINVSVEELEKIFKDNCITSFSEYVDFQKHQLKNNNPNRSAINIARATKRAKECIFDIIYINSWELWVTFTLNPSKVDRYNSKECSKKCRNWLDYRKKKYNISYLLVPEYCPSTGGIHFHALISGYPFYNLVRAIKHDANNNPMYHKDGSPIYVNSKSGRPVYNMPEWSLGWTTVSIIDNNSVFNSNIKLAHYITKYVTKDIKKIFGKYFWSSRNLKREVDTEYCISDYDSLPLKEYEVPNTDIKLKYDSQFDYILGGNNNENKK